MSLRDMLTLLILATLPVASRALEGEPRAAPRSFSPRPIATEPTVKYDYDIVYVRAPRKGDDKNTPWPEAFDPTRMAAGSDLMLLHPDGTEELLVPGGDGAVLDPYVSFDGAWVYYSRMHRQRLSADAFSIGADIYKIEVKTRAIVRLTRQEFTPNTGAGGRRPHGLFNLGPCPLPGGKVMFTSNRNGFFPPKGYTTVTMQLFVMDDDGSNVEMIGHLNVGSALHPTILRDGRVMFSSYETQGMRDLRLWSIWTIRPDGTQWAPLLSNFREETLFHFMTQLSDGRIVVEEYYNLNNSGFGTYFCLPENPSKDYAPFGPGFRASPRNLTFIAFTPAGMHRLTPFISSADYAAPLSDPRDKNSPRLGKVTHPSGAPDGHLLTVWSPGPVNLNPFKKPAVDAGIYLIKDGKPIARPSEMLLIKNDPRYNEQWPRALVPYRRIYGVDEPRRLPPLANDGKLSHYLPEGTPFGLIGTSSLYKRESFPNGMVPEGGVTARWSAKSQDPWQGLDRLYYGLGHSNWISQGADSGPYENKDIHAIRIITFEPRSERVGGGPLFLNQVNERMRILGEFPVRKFTGGRQPTDPDGNPDTSFLAKIPADVPFTFQTLDKNGMVLNMAQTWHQVRPGEIRNDCGGCHSHSQKPTLFEQTAAARPDYVPFDLTAGTPLLTTRARDESGKQWDEKEETGLHYVTGVKNVEYYRDVKPILDRSCVPCHTQKDPKPPGNLALDDDKLVKNVCLCGGMSLPTAPRPVPGTYLRLAFNRWGGPPGYGYRALAQMEHPQMSRYVRAFQSRRSLLIWKIYGRRLDGWNNGDFPSEAVPGEPSSLQWKGQSLPATRDSISRTNLDYTGSIMPPPKAVAGLAVALDGHALKVAPLTDEDRLTFVRWIDLGCPIDLDYQPNLPERRGYGWMLDETRPTLTVTHPRTGVNKELARIVIGMHDYYTGLIMESFRVVASFPVDGAAPGENLAGRFRPASSGVWELRLNRPITNLNKGLLTVSVNDRQGNTTRIERAFSVAP